MAKKAAAKRSKSKSKDDSTKGADAVVSGELKVVKAADLGDEPSPETVTKPAPSKPSPALPQSASTDWEPVGYSTNHQLVSRKEPATAPPLPSAPPEEPEPEVQKQAEPETETQPEPATQPEPEIKDKSESPEPTDSDGLDHFQELPEQQEAPDSQDKPPVKSTARPEAAPPKRKRGKKLKRLLLFLLLLIILGGLGTAGYEYKYWYLPRHQNHSKNQNDINVVIAEIGRHVVLPTGEKPVMAAVSDKSQITSPFLKEADYGDRVLVYAKAQKIIIYRPSIDRIIDIGHITLPGS